MRPSTFASWAAKTRPIATASPWRKSMPSRPGPSAKPAALECVRKGVAVVERHPSTNRPRVRQHRRLPPWPPTPSRHLFSDRQLVEIFDAQERVLRHLAAATAARGGRVERVSVSHRTALGCERATRFLPSGALIAVLPPSSRRAGCGASSCRAAGIRARPAAHRGRGRGAERRRNRRGCARPRPASPPNLRSASEARTSAVIDSATTPMAGTAVTSVRSRKLTVDSFVTTSTVCSTGRFSVASGFMATRATRRAPLEMPPSIPPPRSVGRTARSPRRGRRRWRRAPRDPPRHVVPCSPISTALTAWIDVNAWARLASSLRSPCTWLPRPTGTP